MIKMILTEKERKELIHAVRLGMIDLVMLMDRTEEDKVALKASAAIVDIFQQLLGEFNDAEIKKQEYIY